MLCLQVMVEISRGQEACRKRGEELQGLVDQVEMAEAALGRAEHRADVR